MKKKTSKREEEKPKASSSQDPPGFSGTKCQQFFEKYKDKDEDMISPEGMERFCNDLEVAPDNIVMLIVAWKLGAKAMGYFSKEEWMTGMKKMGCDSLDKLKPHLKKLLWELEDPESFKEIYSYGFDFAKDKGQKSLDLNTALAMLQLLMSNRSEHTAQILQFLQEKAPVKVINRDQWMNIKEFCDVIKPDLSNYDEMSAWPVILDEYVEWRKQNK